MRTLFAATAALALLSTAAMADPTVYVDTPVGDSVGTFCGKVFFQSAPQTPFVLGLSSALAAAIVDRHVAAGTPMSYSLGGTTVCEGGDQKNLPTINWVR